MICPILALVFVSNTEPKDLERASECLRERCAWWIEKGETARCAIKELLLKERHND